MSKKENSTPALKCMTFEIKPLADSFEKPVRAKRGSIGYDLTVPEDIYIPAHSRIGVPMKFAINLPYGIEAKIESRSGFSLRGIEGEGHKEIVTKFFGFIPVWHKVYGKHYFDADVLPGKVDPNYTDEVHVLIKNNDVGFLLKAGTRIAQMTFYQVRAPFFKIVEELSCKSRGGGLGSSGSGRISNGSGARGTVPSRKAKEVEEVEIDVSQTEEMTRIEDIDQAVIPEER